MFIMLEPSDVIKPLMVAMAASGGRPSTSTILEPALWHDNLSLCSCPKDLDGDLIGVRIRLHAVFYGLSITAT